MRKRFLAITPIPSAWDRDELLRRLERVARDARDVGIHPLETFYSMDRHEAYTLIDAVGPDEVRRLCERAGFDAQVVAADRIHTELLAEPRRD